MIVAIIAIVAQAQAQAQGLAVPQPPAPEPVITMPRPLSQLDTSPYYPPESLRREEQGLTLLRCTLLVSGRLSACGVRTSSGWPLLDEAAFRVADEYVYSPYMIDGVPTELAVVVPVRWLIQ